MKNHFKRVITILLIAALCLSMAACNDAPDGGSSSISADESNVQSGTDVSVHSDENPDDGFSSIAESGDADSEASIPEPGQKSNAVSSGDKKDAPVPITDTDDIPDKAPDYPTFKNDSGNELAKIDTVKGKTISLLCVDYAQWEPNGVGNVLLKKYYGATVEQHKMPNSNLTTEFTTAYLSGDPYDLVTDMSVFPQFVVQNVIEPLNNRIDFTIPVISKYKEIFDAYSYAGYNFFLPWVYNPHALIYFNKEVFEDAHLDLNGDGVKGDDPYSLFLSGDWTWSVFKNAVKKTHRVNTRNEVMTWGLLARNWTESKLVYITGQHLTKKSGGKLVSNLGNSDFQRIFTDYVAMINDDKIVKHGDDSIYNIFNNGKAAMLYGPSYMTKGDYFPTIFAKQNVGLAPVPKDDKSSEYHVPGICYGFWVSKGGFNRNGKFDVDLLNAFLNAAVVEEVERSQKGSTVNNMLRDEFIAKWSAKNRKFTNAWYAGYMDIQKSIDDGTKPFVEPFDECINIAQILDVMTGWGEQPPGTFAAAVNMFEGELQQQLDDLAAYDPD